MNTRSKKLITFSLWGDDPKYCVGAIRNAELTRRFYSGWLPRFYIGTSVPEEIIKELRQHTDQIILMDQPGDWRDMFLRFHPASEDDVEIFISRDCDSRLSEREAAAVQEWIDSPRLVHSMGDHPHHFNPSRALMGGMFGMKQHACPEMTKLIDKFIMEYPDAWQCDQSFLKDIIWSRIQHKVLAHSDIHPGCQRFSITRKDKEFIGAIIGPNEERLHPEHHVML